MFDDEKEVTHKYYPYIKREWKSLKFDGHLALLRENICCLDYSIAKLRGQRNPRLRKR